MDNLSGFHEFSLEQIFNTLAKRFYKTQSEWKSS